MASDVSIKVVLQRLWHHLPATMYPVGKEGGLPFPLVVLFKAELRSALALNSPSLFPESSAHKPLSCERLCYAMVVSTEPETAGSTLSQLFWF